MTFELTAAASPLACELVYNASTHAFPEPVP